MVSLACRLIDDGDTRLALNALLTAALKCHQFNADQGARESVVEAADLLGLPAEEAKLLAIYGLATPAQLGMTIVQRLAGVSPSDPVVASGPVEAAESLHLYALALTMVPEFRLAAQFHEAAIDSLRAQGRLGLLSRALASHAVTGLALGDWRLARNAAEECLVLAAEPEIPSTRSSVGGGHQAGRRQLDSGTARLVLGTMAANRGDNEAATRLIDAGARVLAPLGDNFSLAMIQAARAAAALASGDSSDAFAHARRVFDPTEPAYNWQVCRWRTLVMDFVDAAWLSGNETQAKRVVAALASEPRGGEFGNTLSYARTILGEEGRLESEHGTPGDRPASAYVQARVELACGVRLRRRRQGREARPHLRAAQEGFDSVGATPWAERASQELRASGETSRRRTPDHRDDLSPQEQQIALLAADGLTNREIAAKLFLSHRTVGAHLYRLFPKLGISSRVELKDALEGQGAVGVSERGPPPGTLGLDSSVS
jgi:DNA-binding CsgD family transcriptional regulator